MTMAISIIESFLQQKKHLEEKTVTIRFTIIIIVAVIVASSISVHRHQICVSALHQRIW